METERTGPILMDEGAPEFPPLLTGHAVLAGASPFETAIAAAKDNSAGAGDLFWGMDNRFLDVSIVLEPEIEAARCQQMLFLLMVAFGDSFGALAPAELGLYYRWPGDIILNSADVGKAYMAISKHEADDVPQSMVVGLKIDITEDHAVTEPGINPGKTTLWDEGCGDISQTELIESLSRHFLTWVNNWQDDGFKPVHESWTGRAKEFSTDYELVWQGGQVKGEFLSLDEEGNLFLKTSSGTVQLLLADTIERY